MTAPTQTFATSLGTIAAWALVIVAIAAAARRRLSKRVWTTAHACAYAIWPVATVHFLLEGSDADTVVARLAVALSVVILAAAVFARGWTSRPTPRPTNGRAGAPPRPLAPMQPISK